MRADNENGMDHLPMMPNQVRMDEGKSIDQDRWYVEAKVDQGKVQCVKKGQCCEAGKNMV